MNLKGKYESLLAKISIPSMQKGLDLPKELSDLNFKNPSFYFSIEQVFPANFRSDSSNAMEIPKTLNPKEVVKEFEELKTRKTDDFKQWAAALREADSK